MQTRFLPANYYGVLALIDTPENAISEVENIGSFGNRALAYAALAGSDPFELAQKENFAQKALELTRQYGGTWEQASKQSEIGKMLICELPAFGVKAFKLSLDTLRKAEKYELKEGEILSSPIENLMYAYRESPDLSLPILLEFISFVEKNAGYIWLLDLAKAMFRNNQSTALEILENSYLELTSSSTETITPAHQKERVERTVERNKKHFVEISHLLGRADLAENISQTVELDFDLKAFSEAISNIQGGNFAQAIKICANAIIRQEALNRLFESGQIEEAIQLITNKDIEIATQYSTNIVESKQADELLMKVSDQPEHVIFGFMHQERLVKLKIALIKELLKSNPVRAKELFDTLIIDNEETPFRFPYWAEAAIITEAGIKWGEQKAKELIYLSTDDVEKELSDAQQLLKVGASFEVERDNVHDVIEKSLDSLSQLGKLMTAEDNNFALAFSAYAEFRGALTQRLDKDKKIPIELQTGWEFIKKEDWATLETWIDDFNFAESRWKYEDKLVDIVRDLVLQGKLELASKLASHFEGSNKWSAEAWISSSSLLETISAFDFEGFDEPDHIFLIRARLMSTKNVELANAYARLYCEFLIHEKWLDDFLGWDLCNLALFLYEHNDKLSAHKYFLLGIQHWFRSEMDDTWDEITEKLMKTDFDFQFKLLQEVLLWNSNRNIRDTVRTMQIFALVLVKNIQYEEVVSFLSAIKRTRNWHLKDETIPTTK